MDQWRRWRASSRSGSPTEGDLPVKAEKDIDGAGVNAVPDLAKILSEEGRSARRPQRRVWAVVLLLAIAGAATGYLMLTGEGKSYSYTTEPVHRGDLSVRSEEHKSEL